MKTKFRILAALLALSLCLGLAACGGETPAGTAPSEAEAAPAETAADTAPADPDRLISRLEENREALGISHIYTREELDRLHAVREPVLAVEAAEGVVFSDSLDPEKREKATHGFGPGHPGDNCFFAVCGRGVRQGIELPSFPMRDVGPTVAGLMGLRLPDAQGTDRSADILSR